MKKSCDPITLVQKSMTRVTRCRECGCICVDIGAFSFRINDDLLVQIGEALTEATTKLTVQKSGSSWSTEQGDVQ